MHGISDGTTFCAAAADLTGSDGANLERAAHYVISVYRVNRDSIGFNSANRREI
jgi:hypothetical protein